MPRFIKVSDNGSVTEDALTQAQMEAPWIEVPFDQQYMLGRELYQLRWEDGQLKLKDRVELAIGGFTFPADGETEVAIGVRGDIPPDQSVTVLINGEAHHVKVGDDIMLTSEGTGQYTIRVEDPLVYASPSERTVVAVSPDAPNDRKDD